MDGSWVTVESDVLVALDGLRVLDRMLFGVCERGGDDGIPRLGDIGRPGVLSGVAARDGRGDGRRARDWDRDSGEPMRGTGSTMSCEPDAEREFSALRLGVGAKGPLAFVGVGLRLLRM